MNSSFKFIGILLLCGFTNFSMYSQEATYGETIEWIQGKLSKFETARYKDLGGSNKWKFTDRYNYTLDSAENCVFIITENMSHTTAQNSSRNDYRRNTQIKFNLQDISSIEYIDEGPKNKYYLIKTLNSAKNIEVTENNYTKSASECRLEADNLEILDNKPERFLKAFRHAMNLCGSRVEKF